MSLNRLKICDCLRPRSTQQPKVNCGTKAANMPVSLVQPSTYVKKVYVLVTQKLNELLLS